MFKNDLISICLPNLNHRLFLEDRFSSILDQSFQNWEAVVIDGYSTDGSWQYIQEKARQDVRIRIYQEPPQGIYAAWNSCLEKARGDLIYIATSDDTMSPWFLEQMSTLLLDHRDCDIAMCGLDLIDTNGRSLSSKVNWESFPAWKFFKTTFERTHVRKAPLDAVLGCALHNIIHSTTQILVRRSVYEKVGGYRTDLQNIADFEWSLRAATVSNIVYTPNKLATWRVHAAQASNDKLGYTSRSMDCKLMVLRFVFESLRKYQPIIASRITLETYTFPFRFQRLIYRIREEKGLCKRLFLILANFWNRPLEGVLVTWWLAKTQGEKELLRHCFVDWVTWKSGVELDRYLVVTGK